jgi:hypothetical protein
MQDDEVRDDFHMEMSRFIPKQIKERTIDGPDYWAYVRAEVSAIAGSYLIERAAENKFDMGF